MRIYNKDGKQIGVQDDKGNNFFFDKKDNLNPPKDFVVKEVKEEKK